VVPTTQWRSATTLPRTLTLNNTAEGYRLASLPVKELEKLRAKSVELGKMTVNETVDLTSKLCFVPTQSELVLEFQKPMAGIFKVELSNARGEKYAMGYDASTNQFFSDRTKSGDASFSDKFSSKIHYSPRHSNDNLVRLHLFFDVASAELFADNGTDVMTEIYFPSEDYDRISLTAEEKPVTVVKSTIWQLKSIWNNQ
jgi:fructan beta-fructosidase